MINHSILKTFLLAVILLLVSWGAALAQAPDSSYKDMGISDPENVKTEVTYDAEKDQYIIEKKAGGIVISTEYLSADEYRRQQLNQSTMDYWKEKEKAQRSGQDKNSLIPPINMPGEGFKTLFGSNKVEIRPQGTAELILGVRVNRNDNPNIPQQQRVVTTFNFDQNIQINLIAKIGDRINFNTNFNTKALFNFENQLNLKYEGGEDDILQLLEFGNVQLPLTGSLIQGSAALFGVKNKLKFGRLEITSIYTQQQGQKQNITVEGGAQVTKFEVPAAQYEANRHYFLTDYFMHQYDQSNASLPFVTSLVQITRIEVWVTNRVNATENVRNIVALLPLGENGFPNPFQYPSNDANPNFDPKLMDQSVRDITSQYLFNVLPNGLEIEKLANARMLAPNEYTFDGKLGYISLNQSLNADEVLAVAFQYTIGGQTYQVGEFSTDIAAPNALVLKLLKSSIQDTKRPNWNWMMKNIYSIGGYNIGPEDFTLNVLYLNPENAAKQNFLPDVPNLSGIPLLRLFNLDRLNQQNDQMPDGYFDFVEGQTIRAQNGRIIFPVREPFSSRYLTQVFQEANPGMNIDALVDKYSFDSLYNTIQQLAELNQEKNRFYLAGSYKGASGSEISLNAFNVPPGSVTVTAGGQNLTEGADYIVDYAAGRVRITNESILNSGIPINIALENNATFNIQQKRMIGTHLDYKFSRNFQVGATVLNLHERPLTQKIDIGQEPISNTQIGVDLNYSTESPFITRLIDKIPGINTKAASTFTINAEIAGIIPGYNKVIDRNGENGVSYIDDFEGAETPIDIRLPFNWKLGSVPQENPNWPNGGLFNDLRYNFNRARFSWFTMDPQFYRQNTITPKNVSDDAAMRSNHFLREIPIQEVFPGFQLGIGQVNTQQVLDLHFYPDERGPYNFDVDALDEAQPNKLVLKNPRSNFGSMMRRMETTDWDAANIAYIEFWMMDPFYTDAGIDLNALKVYEDGVGAINLNTLPDGGGDFYVQVGNMNEDVLRDGRMEYENGLPTPVEPNRPTTTTVWGRVPLLQPITQNFDNDPATREAQDVGLDGLPDTEELDFFSGFVNAALAKYSNPAIQDSIRKDPAADNYRHFNGSAYQNDVTDAYNAIHARYKYYQNPERNSPANNINESFGQLPNSEDINSNFTLDQPEGYYQYRVSIRPEDLDEIGQNFITDIRISQTNTLPAGGSKEVKWVQFRIPIRTENKEQFGSILNFRSVRFMRMLVKNFPDDIFLRFATLQLVRADWRVYESSLWDPTAFGTQTEGDLNVTTVNVEENQKKQPFPYALPPGITREIDPINPQIQQLNEQSLVLNVCNLQDGEARGVYKNTNYDMRAYKYLKMWVHEEQVLTNPLDSNDLSVFIRLGQDATQNFYQVEIPLKPSDVGQVPPLNATIYDDPTYQEVVWPAVNQLVIDLQNLPELKIARNKGGYGPMDAYDTILPSGQRVFIYGNPNIANVRSIMIGVRNPHVSDPENWNNGQNGNKQDDGQSKCAQVWVNELRLTDYFENGGWAARTRATLQLADFGQIGASAGFTSFGWGNIDQKPMQRSRDNTTTFDFSMQFELGKFFGQKSGVTIPVFFGYSTSIANPQFNPLDPDVRFKDALSALPTPSAQDSLRNIAQTVMVRKNFNISNMRKNRTNTQKTPKIYDIENWDLSYSYTEENFRDIRTEFHNYTEHRGSLGYTFTPTVKYWEPFKKSKNLKSKWLNWIKDFNFTWSPKRFAFRANIQRDVDEFKMRNVTEYDLLILPTYRKNFTWVRTYEFQYNPFRSLTFTFNATNNSRIDEPEMRLDPSVVPRVPFFGRNTSYTHNMDVNYTLPLSKIPLTDWITATASYNVRYTWTASTMERTSQDEFTLGRFGNIAQNSNTIKGTVQLNMQTLYNKVPWLRDLNKPNRNKNQAQPKKDPKKEEDEEEKKKKVKIVTWEKQKVSFKAGRKKLIKHNLKTENVTVRVTTPEGKDIKGETQIVDKKRVRFIASEDAKDATILVEGRIEKKPFRWMIIPEVLAKVATGLKNVSVTYNQTNGTILPGYRSGTSILGMDVYNPSVGPDFVFGRQYNDIDLANKVVQSNWLVRDSTMNILFMRTFSESLNATATYEPFKGIRVTLTANRTFAENYQSNYRFVPSADGGNGDFLAQNPLTTGNFTMSYLPIGTAFGGGGPNFTSRLFANMLTYRSYFSKALAEQNQANAGPIDNNAQYQVGYGQTQQDVLMYSFLAAYRGISPESQTLDLFPAIPFPNWRIQFDGLKEIPAIKKALKTITITHSYQSTLSIAGYQSNSIYNNDDPAILKSNPFALSAKDDNGNFISRFFINSVTIVESFNPLIKVDLTFNNSLQTTVEIKSSRNISLNFPNSQITEVNTFEVIVGAGYIFKEVKLPFRINGKQLKNNLNVRLDFGLRDNATVIRKIQDQVEQVTAGMQAITIRAFAEYTVNSSVSVRLFADHLINNPFVSNQFPTGNTNAGLSIRFTLTQ